MNQANRQTGRIFGVVTWLTIVGIGVADCGPVTSVHMGICRKCAIVHRVVRSEFGASHESAHPRSDQYGSPFVSIETDFRS